MHATAMLTIAAGLVVSVFFAVWNPEKVYVGEYIDLPVGLTGRAVSFVGDTAGLFSASSAIRVAFEDERPLQGTARDALGSPAAA